MDWSSSGSSFQGISQERILEWVAISSARGSSWPRDLTCISCVSCIGRWILYHWATWEPKVRTGCGKTVKENATPETNHRSCNERENSIYNFELQRAVWRGSLVGARTLSQGTQPLRCTVLSNLARWELGGHVSYLDWAPSQTQWGAFEQRIISRVHTGMPPRTQAKEGRRGHLKGHAGALQHQDKDFANKSVKYRLLKERWIQSTFLKCTIRRGKTQATM